MNPPIPPPVPVETYPVAAKPGGGKKWVLLGCGGCLGLLVLGGIAIAVVTYFAFGAMKKSDVYIEAVELAKNSPEVQAALGPPIDTGWMLQGSFNYNNGSGDANLTIPLKGSKAEGTLLVVGQKPVGGAWVYSQLEALLPGGTKVNLIPNGEPPAAVDAPAAPTPGAEPEKVDRLEF